MPTIHNDLKMTFDEFLTKVSGKSVSEESFLLPSEEESVPENLRFVIGEAIGLLGWWNDSDKYKKFDRLLRIKEGKTQKFIYDGRFEEDDFNVVCDYFCVSSDIKKAWKKVYCITKKWSEKSTSEKVSSLDEKIEQLKRQKESIINQENQKRRKARTRRLIRNGAIAEQYLQFNEWEPDDFEIAISILVNNDTVKSVLQSINMDVVAQYKAKSMIQNQEVPEVKQDENPMVYPEYSE